MWDHWFLRLPPLMGLADVAGADPVFNVIIHLGPEHATACPELGFEETEVALVEIPEDFML